MSSLLARVPPKWRERLDHWPLWMAIAYFALVAMIVGLYVLNGRTSAAQADAARNEAIRLAERRAAAQSAFDRCKASIVPTRRVSLHVEGVNEAFRVLLTNSVRNHRATPTTSPQYQAQKVNIRNLRKAIRKVAAVKKFPAPTLEECKARRDELLIVNRPNP